MTGQPPNATRIGIVVSDLLEFGGLEKIATELAIALRQEGQPVCVVSTGWAPASNQYRVNLRDHQVPYIQAPRWLHRLASDWPTKERLLARVLWACWPLIAATAAALMIGRRQSWAKSFASARGWLSHKLLGRLIGPNRHQSLARLMLTWWQWRWQPGVVHLQGYTSALLFALDWAAARRLPTVYTENQTPDPRFDWWKDFGHSINKATIVVAASDASAQALREVCQVRRPIVTFYPAVTDPVSEGHSIALRDQAPGAPLNVTTIARLSVTKGLQYLLEAIQSLNGAFPATRFRVYGDGPLRQELAEYAAKLGLRSEDLFAGTFSRAELPGIMASTDIFLMSSILEGLPLALVEAMAYGRPIIATAVGGNAEIIEDGVSGMLCPPRDPVCLSNQLKRLLGASELRTRLARAARQAYEQGGFTPTAMAQHHMAIYQQALDLGSQTHLANPSVEI
jgi:glycosyltransferase involved in cell wall biosynthesis